MLNTKCFLCYMSVLSTLMLFACNQSNVGYVDSSKIVSEAVRFQTARDSLTSFNNRWKKEAQGLDSLVKLLADQITAQSKRNPKLDSLMRAYNSKQQDLQRFIQASSEKSRALEQKLMVPHLKSTNTCLEKFIAKNHLTLLLGSQQSGTILAGDPKADYTDRVILFLNSECK